MLISDLHFSNVIGCGGEISLSEQGTDGTDGTKAVDDVDDTDDVDGMDGAHGVDGGGVKNQCFMLISDFPIL